MRLVSHRSEVQFRHIKLFFVAFLLHGMSNLIATVAVLLVSRVSNFSGDFGADARLIARLKIRFRYLAKNIYIFQGLIFFIT